MFLAINFFAIPFSIWAEAKNMVEGNDAVLRKTIKLLLYGSTSFLGIASLILFLFNKSKIGIGLFLLGVFSLYVDYSYVMITGDYFSLDYMVMVLTEKAQIYNILYFYKWKVLGGVALSIALATSFLFLRRLIQVRFSLLLALFCYALCLTQATYILRKTGGLREKYIASTRIPSLLIYLKLNGQYHSLGMPFTSRELNSSITPTHSSPQTILYFVDESITGSYLSINGYKEETTPYLKKIEGSYLNLGMASSVSNTSSLSNYILRNGVQLKDIPDKGNKTLSFPSLFSYAKRAGYQTLFIDAQLYNNSRVQNFFSHKEKVNIDKYLTDDGNHKRSQKDFVLLDSLVSFLSQNPKSFVFFVKNGMHIPYFMQYPEEKEYFKPTYTSIANQLGAISSEKRSALLNTYKNGLLWTVDHFIQTLLEKVNKESTVIIYTSDHGQSLEDESVSMTHGTKKNPPLVQANVPLLLFGTPLLERFKTGITKDCYTQFQIFPSLLALMGYPQKVTEPYGMPLWVGPDSRSRKFISRSLWHAKPIINDIPCSTEKKLSLEPLNL